MGSLHVDHVSVEFPAGPHAPVVVALKEVDLKIQPGEFVVALGASGCGKSTLLNLLAGFLSPSQGQIKLNDAVVSGPGADRAVVFQKHALLPWLNVIDNVAFGLKLRGMGKSERYVTARKHLVHLGLGAFEIHPVYQLSGGMQQRCGLARALAIKPSVLLMDEPFAALDAQNRVILQAELVRLWEQTGKTVIYITHSIEEALLLGDRCVVMTAQPGRIKQIISVPFPHPRDLIALSAAPDFGRMKLDIWRVLEDEVMRARAEMDA